MTTATATLHLPAPAPPLRVDRCLRLVERGGGMRLRATERCPNPRLDGSALCGHHLGEAVSEFRQLTAQSDAH